MPACDFYVTKPINRAELLVVAADCTFGTSKTNWQNLTGESPAVAPTPVAK